MKHSRFPEKQGLYDPAFEHDSCGVGFVCNIKGEKSNDVIARSIEVLEHMSHRGAVGADPSTGDGAGILIQTPHEFFKKVCANIKICLPEFGQYGAGLIFLPTKEKERVFCEETFAKVIQGEGHELLGWREVPVNDSIIGKGARDTQPVLKQIFIANSGDADDQMAFERKLYVIRKQVEKIIKEADIDQKNYFYITSISSRTLSYKGLLMPEQVKDYFIDLKNESIISSLALVHSRYSTNTFPTWDLAQPFRFLAHNGEINTLRGNINWFKARERFLASELFGQDIQKVKPVIVEGGSDSSVIDNVFELLVLAGRSLEHSMRMLIPSAWGPETPMDDELREFYEYHACLMEPWDGPAAIAFTDGKDIGAVLDRNGLRPARYIVTKDGFVVMASEVGVLDIDPVNILHSGRIEPGKMFFIDTEAGQIIDDSKMKERIAKGASYGDWIKQNMVYIEDLPQPDLIQKKNGQNIHTLLKAFGYTREDMKFILKPMAGEGKEPVGSMGNDTPHAVLSKTPQLLYNYFKQLFAQVTNPAIDPIREELVMSLDSFIGAQGNILDQRPEHAHKLRVRQPVLTNEQLQKIRSISVNSFKTKTISTLFNSKESNGFESAITRICKESEGAIEEGYTFIILSDTEVNRDKAALPALLSVGAVHHHLVRKGLRAQAGLIIESAEPREVHHFALLFGFGADCVNPYLAFEAIIHLIGEKQIDQHPEIAIINYRKAVHKGVLKVLSKMGISTLQSYRGAQIFEALGLADDIIERCFTGTVSRIGGATLEDIKKETITRHEAAYFSEDNLNASYLDTGGVYQWKRDGEFHLWNPETIAFIQDSVRKNDYSIYKKFAELINDQSKNPTTLRSLFRFKNGRSVPVAEVEPVDQIVKRFVTGAMSFGSISKMAHKTMAIAMNRLGAKSNSGEGGEDPARFTNMPNGDSARSAIKQVASGRFGVTTNYLVNADELQIKVAQGAKPGEGGQLPGHKVSALIARTRYTTPGVTLISPPPHHDIYSIEDLAQLIFDLKNVNPRARVSVKLVSESGVGTVAVGVAKGRADMILISGGDGGTGASPRSSIRHAGLPWELGLSETHQTLVLNGLRNRVRLQTDGQMRTGRDVAIAALLGAEEFGFGTAVLITMGCVMLRHCHLNNCSLGVATQDKMLQKRFQGKPEYIVNYMNFIAQELREIMAELGLKSVDEMIGRTDLLEINEDISNEKAKGIDLSRILYRPEGAETRCICSQDRGTDEVLDRKLIDLAQNALREAKSVKIEVPIKNTDRTTGAMLSGRICEVYGEEGLLEDTITCKFTGVAGQSFGAFLAQGVTFQLEGLANDYVGKSISGGKIIIYADKRSDYISSENIIMGNTAFYGAISGEAYIAGIAGERFCIRNSGLYAVVEGVGDHGCEYMTGGRVVILGKTGRNFAAGMSGGVAYVYDSDKCLADKCNMSMVQIEDPKEDDKSTIYNLVHNHYRNTGSLIAKKVLDDFVEEIKIFKKVMPVEYRLVMATEKMEARLGLLEVSDG